MENGDVVLYYGKSYKIISICNKGGKDVLKLRSKDGRCVVYNVAIEEVSVVRPKEV